MEFKLNKNYNELLPKYIADNMLANEIQYNIDFVETYIDKVDAYFFEDKEKQIAYRQLGCIVFSCVEALWKSIVLIVNRNCKNRDCKEKCNYRKFDNLDRLSNSSPKAILFHLVNMRLLHVHPFEEVAIDHLQNLRNHIHLTRSLIDGDKSVKFNKQFVEDILRLYYVTINQAEMNYWYYDEPHPCLRELDGNAYLSTEKQQKVAHKEYYTNNVILACIDIFYKKPVTESNAYFLRYLSKAKDIATKSLADEMGKWLYYEGAHFRTEEQYQEALKHFNDNLLPYLPQESDLLFQIEERRIHYERQFKYN